MTPLAAYVLLFSAVGVGFIFVHLLAGKLIRPSKQSAEKETIYECGEPTIGSAWIQFDLRFYVVALLFVVFDVEVAFFFPWAEVFGKANAVRNLPAIDRNTATHTDYNQVAARVMDLASPSGSNGGQPMTPGLRTSSRERELWKKLATLDADELAAYRLLGDATTTMVQRLGEPRISDLRSLSSEQIAELKKHDQSINGLITEMVKDSKAEIVGILQSIDQLDAEKLKRLESTLATPAAAPAAPGGPPAPASVDAVTTVASLRKHLEERPSQIDGMLRSRALPSLVTLTRTDIEILSGAPSVWEKLDKFVPGTREKARELADSQLERIKSQASSVLSALRQSSPANTELWALMSPSRLQALGSLDAAQLQSLQKLTPEGLLALQYPLAEKAREAADTLAWLSLVEIILFFGILLVAFAYLWRRGDLEWVRSLNAEREAATPIAPLPTSSRLPAQELETVGKGS